MAVDKVDCKEQQKTRSKKHNAFGGPHGYCLIFSGNARVIHIGFDDPPKLAKNAASEEEALGHYRRVRDQIRRFIEGLPKSLQA